MRVSSGTDSIIIQPNKNKKTNKNKTKVWTWEAGRAGGELEASWSPVRCGVKSHCGASGHAHRRWGGRGWIVLFQVRVGLSGRRSFHWKRKDKTVFCQMRTWTSVTCYDKNEDRTSEQWASPTPSCPGRCLKKQAKHNISPYLCHTCWLLPPALDVNKFPRNGVKLKKTVQGKGLHVVILSN